MAEASTSPDVDRMKRLIATVKQDPQYDLSEAAADHLAAALRHIRSRRPKELEVQAKTLHVISSIDYRHTVDPNYAPILNVLRGYLAARHYRFGMALFYYGRATDEWRALKRRGIKADAGWARRNARWRRLARLGAIGKRVALFVLPITLEDMVSAMVAH